MIAARQELDLRPQLERIDALLLRSAGVEAGSLRFAFRPPWQLSDEGGFVRKVLRPGRWLAPRAHPDG